MTEKPSALQASALQARTVIVSFYKKATYCYGLPFGFLSLQLLLNVVSNFNFQPFLALFFLTILPLSALGIAFTKRGFTLAVKSGDREKKDVGYANLILGSIIVVLGLVGLALGYMMTK